MSFNFKGNSGSLHPSVKSAKEFSESMKAERERLAQAEATSLGWEIDRLYMITQALWEMLKERTNLTEQDLLDKVNEIDLRDGKLDNRLKKESGPQKCGSCGRTSSRHNPLCMYCGKPLQDKQGTFDR